VGVTTPRTPNSPAEAASHVNRSSVPPRAGPSPLMLGVAVAVLLGANTAVLVGARSAPVTAFGAGPVEPAVEAVAEGLPGPDPEAASPGDAQATSAEAAPPPAPADAPPAPATAPPPVEAPPGAVPVAAPPPAPPAQPPAAPEPARVALAPADPRLAAFAGLSTWIDLYDVAVAPRDQVGIASAAGVQTVFVQTARFNSPADIHDPVRLAETIDAAHDAGLKVMTWYIPDFLDPARDERRSQAAMAFTTPRGDRADAFGLDIELEHEPDIALRTARLIELSTALRGWAGPDYPMAAIVLPPLQLDLRPSWWPDFPYAAMAQLYDVTIPMSYSSFRGLDPETTYGWNLRNVQELRVRAGDPTLAVHLAGGIADRMPAIDAFTRAARDAHVLGAGLYDLTTTHPQAWPYLRALRSEPNGVSSG